MKTRSFEFEGQSYTIRRLTHREVQEMTRISQENPEEAQLYTISRSLVEPKLTPEEVAEYDGTVTTRIINEINQFTFLPMNLPNGSPSQSERGRLEDSRKQNPS
jgi:hypothetical protein